MRICLMIEGQFDVSWDEWIALARACERHGIEGLFRSDHYTHPGGHGRDDALDAWATIAGLAAVTERLRLGTLVSPVTSRHPSELARVVATADHISGGRVELGMGAGWMEVEHSAYGFPFPSTGTRMEMLGEQMEIVVRQWTEDGFDFEGRHYQLEDCRALPKPVQEPHPNLIVGGSAGPRSAAIAARWADEYNTLLVGAEEVRGRRRAVESAWAEAGRDPDGLTFSLMTTCMVGRDRTEVRERVGRFMTALEREGDVDDMLEQLTEERVVGTVEEVGERLRDLADAGVDRIMLQHLLHDDLDMVRLIGEEIIPGLS
jgi:F420-dependent oxidoreductase-like protein